MNNQSFAEAVARAKMLAAKLGSAAPPSGSGDSHGHSPGAPVGMPAGIKRALSSDYGSEPEPKRLAALSDPFGAQLAAMRGGGGGGPPGGNLANLGIKIGLGIVGSGDSCSEEIRIPDQLVGLIIGRGGEQISKIQSETGCRVQVAPDSGGGKDRPVNLAGNKRAIEKCKEMIADIVISKGQDIGKTSHPGLGFGNKSNSNQQTIEVMIPGSKVGLIIGKGGETIRNLQEKTGTKMFILQENMFEECDKPLRIVGEPDLVENARQIVSEMLIDKPMGEFKSRNEYGSHDGGGGMGGGGYGGGRGSETMKFPVPKISVGLIIGKGGEMIKRIQMETGARVQFDPINSTMGDMDEQLAIITGKPDQIRLAQLKIEELVETALNGGGGGPGGSGGGGGGGERRSFGGGGGRLPRGDEDRLTIPVNRVGMVIGKGGENIREINQQSGAHCEIDKNLPQEGPERTFVIRGTRDQIDHAKELIMQKVNTLPPGGKGSRDGYGGHDSYGSNGNSSSSSWSGGDGSKSGGTGGGDAAAQWAAYYAQYYAQAAAVPQAGAAQPDYTQQWIEYYRSQGQHAQADMLEAQAKGGKVGDSSSSGSGGAATNGNSSTTSPGSAGAAAPGGAGASADYSQQWADHYRAMGKIQEAEAIETYIKAQKAQQASGGAPPAPGAGGYNYSQYGTPQPPGKSGVTPPGE